MRFFTLLPVRDEAEIIRECLEAQLEWAHRIFVFDTGSVDDSWEIVQEMAAKHKQIKPLCYDPVYFSETKVRAYIFNKAREEMKDGDWFMRFDADEFYHMHPADFIKEYVRPSETIVYHQYYNFALLQSEADQLSSRQAIMEDRKKPIAERRRSYELSVYAEPRMCRYRSTMQWSSTVSFPYNAGFVSKHRVPIRHYPHRDPLQLDRRCRLRAVMLADQDNRADWGNGDGFHWNIDDWRKFVTPDDQPGLKTWKEGEDLELVHQENHLAPFPKRLAQRMVHTFALPILDRRRPAFGTSTPKPLTEKLQEQLRRELDPERDIGGFDQ